MYDWPEEQAANDAWWAALHERLRAAGFAAPETLDRDRDTWTIWRDPALLVAQTCGFPLVTRLKDTVVPLVTPHYAVSGCDGPTYSSALVVRADDPATTPEDLIGRRAAINGPESQSGMAALRHLFAGTAAGRAVFSDVITSGSHRYSVRAVAEDRADIAAIDAVSWHLAQRHDNAWAGKLRVLGWTEPMPALPLVTAVGSPAAEIAALKAVLMEAFAAPNTAGLRAPLMIAGATPLTMEDYAPIAAADAADRAAGYPTVA